MTYVSPNFKTKKAIKDALVKGKTVMVFEPGLGEIPDEGEVFLEGPHSPEPHKWTAKGKVKDGRLLSLK